MPMLSLCRRRRPRPYVQQHQEKEAAKVRSRPQARLDPEEAGLRSGPASTHLQREGYNLRQRFRPAAKSQGQDHRCAKNKSGRLTEVWWGYFHIATLKDSTSWD